MLFTTVLRSISGRNELLAHLQSKPFLHNVSFQLKRMKVFSKKPIQVSPVPGESAQATDWVDELRIAGVRGKAGQKIEFSRLEHLAATRYLHAEGETKEIEPKRIVVSFGSLYAPLGKEQVELAIEEAQAHYKDQKS